VKDRSNWTIGEGTPEEIDAQRIEYWRAQDPNFRVSVVAELRKLYLGENAERLERTYRDVELPQR
jgi:hypothetical protein